MRSITVLTSEGSSWKNSCCSYVIFTSWQWRPHIFQELPPSNLPHEPNMDVLFDLVRVLRDTANKTSTQSDQLPQAFTVTEQSQHNSYTFLLHWHFLHKNLLKRNRDKGSKWVWFDFVNYLCNCSQRDNNFIKQEWSSSILDTIIGLDWA